MLFYKLCEMYANWALTWSTKSIVIILVILFGLGILFGKEVRQGLLFIVLAPIGIYLLGEVANFFISCSFIWALLGWLFFIAIDASVVVCIVLIVKSIRN